MSSSVLNPASVSALLSAVVSLVGGAGAWLLGRAPEWEDVKPLAWVGFTAALTAGCHFSASLDVPLAASVWAGRTQVLAVALHLTAWHVYFRQWRQPRPARGRFWVLYGPILAAGALALVPDAVYREAVRLRPVPWLGVVYRAPLVAPSGLVVYAVLGAYAVSGIVRLARLPHPGLPFPRMHLAVVSLLAAMGLHDAAVSAGLPLATPSLLDFALYGPAAVVAALTLRRVADAAADLHRLRTGLELAVVERTLALQRSRTELAATERLAALGRFSAGFAREVSGPAAVLAESLEALADELRDDPRPRVGRNLADARSGLERINALAHRLVAAGRDADAPAQPLGRVRVGPAVEAALAAARGGAAANVAVEAEVPPGLTVLGHEAGLVQVLARLVRNGIGAIPPERSGTVRIRAEAAGAWVRVFVEDDGAGMSEVTLLHVFEPFWGGPGSDAGLGLAVSRSVVEAMGGTLRFESALGRGSTAVLELAAGEPDAPAARHGAASLEGLRRLRILIVDDDVRTRRTVADHFPAHHEVVVAESVPEALAELGGPPFDLLACEAALSMGGAERFWQELLLRAPQLQSRVVFVASRPTSPAARAFLARQPQPILDAPLDAAGLENALRRLDAGAPAGPPERPAPACHAAIGKLRRS